VGLRTNSSRRSHAELDEAESLDAGDPEELGSLHREISAFLPRLAVLGGCCGTDQRHVEAIARATLPVLWEGLQQL
jgi:homocysteine S-methyltransferase